MHGAGGRPGPPGPSGRAPAKAVVKLRKIIETLAAAAKKMARAPFLHRRAVAGAFVRKMVDEYLFGRLDGRFMYLNLLGC